TGPNPALTSSFLNILFKQFFQIGIPLNEVLTKNSGVGGELVARRSAKVSCLTSQTVVMKFGQPYSYSGYVGSHKFLQKSSLNLCWTDQRQLKLFQRQLKLFSMTIETPVL